MATIAEPLPRRRAASPTWRFIGRLFREKPLGAVGGGVFLVFLFCGIFADVLAPYGMNQINPVNRLKPPSWAFPVGPGMPQIIVTLGLLLGIAGSRIIRSAVVSVRENMYVHAAQSIGASTPRILWRHIFPNVLPPIIVLFTTRVGVVILIESALSFLGLGVPPPAPTWGGMLSGSGRSYMFQGPWLALAPGLCLTIVVYATNMFGDALRDLFDPRMRGAR
jgi:ABC-type dipeptide/oligopeptide/nickel transport system permease subunit